MLNATVYMDVEVETVNGTLAILPVSLTDNGHGGAVISFFDVSANLAWSCSKHDSCPKEGFEIQMSTFSIWDIMRHF